MQKGKNQFKKSFFFNFLKVFMHLQNNFDNYRVMSYKLQSEYMYITADDLFTFQVKHIYLHEQRNSIPI